MTNLDVFKYLKKCDRAFDIILVDPPFTKKIAHEALIAIDQSEAIKPGTEIFIESTSQEKVEEVYEKIKRKSHKSYGDKFLSQYICG